MGSKGALAPGRSISRQEERMGLGTRRWLGWKWMRLALRPGPWPALMSEFTRFLLHWACS